LRYNASVNRNIPLILSPMAEMARKVDPDRFLCAMFAPEDKREGLFILLAFNHEIARIRELVSEPMIGRIRLEWWREAIDEIAAGRPARRHEVLGPLATAMHLYQLPVDAFHALIDAREPDLDPAPFASMAEVLVYAEHTTLPLYHLWQRVQGLEERAIDKEVAAAWALCGLLRALPQQQGMGRLFLPDDLLLKHGLIRSEALADRQREQLRPAVAEVASIALAKIKGQRGPWPTLTRLYLKQLKKSGWDVYDNRHRQPHPLAALWLLYDYYRARWN
jgi:phytoene synthase